MNTIQLSIQSCGECPKLKSHRHYTADSFEHVQEWLCSAKNNKVIGYMEWNDVPKIPQWCPLKVAP